VAVLPAPKPRWYVTFANVVLDFAMNKLGVDAAFAAIIVAEPWMATPFAAVIVKWALGIFIGKAEERLAIFTDGVLISVGNQYYKSGYDAAVKVLQDTGDMTDEQLQAAKDAFDKLVSRVTPS
jgi:hypothetical protein